MVLRVANRLLRGVLNSDNYKRIMICLGKSFRTLHYQSRQLTMYHPDPSWTALEVAACGYMWPWAIEYLPTASSMIG